MGYMLPRRYRRALVLLAAFAAAALLASTAQGAGGAVPIPPLPGPPVATYIGAPATADPIDSFAIPQNPYMAPDPGNNIHDDAYGTNTYPGPGPLGVAPKVTTSFFGVQECATEAFDAAGQIVGLCPNLRGASLLLINPSTLNVRATFTLPPRHLKVGENPLTDLCGGAYFYLDNLDRAVVDTTARTIEVVADTGSTFVLQHTYNLAPLIPASDCMIALMPDWKGNIWFVTSKGIVGDVNPATGLAHAVATGEGISNSISVDETGGVFLVTDGALYRFDADPLTGAPRITWRQPYDHGTRQKPGQLEEGSGTTPTLLGSDMVAITDNADPQMHVLVYHRSALSGGAQVCSDPVFTPGQSDTENSMVAVGNSLYVDNNYGYKGPQSTLLGKTTEPGISRVEINGSTCTTAWTSQQIAPTCVPKASLATGLLYVYTKPPESDGVDAWYLTAIDLRTGATAFSRLAGTGPQFNNHYASVYLSPSGAAYIATLTGMVRVADS